jgi:4-amino-4-deoxy-L-arabinose transferase-like glycosyltransferase
VSSEDAQRQHEPSANYLLVGLIVLAFVLRFWRLGDWGFDSDETFTLRDSIDLNPSNPRPLLYLLNHYIVSPFVPLNELGLRLLPALFGVLAIPVFYFVARRLVGARAALFGALLLTFSSLHVYYSQFARYWTLVFLLSTIFPYFLYLGLREHNRRLLILGALLTILAALAHPVSILLVGGLGVWALVTYLRVDRFEQLWNQKTVRWTTWLLVLLAAAVALRFVPLLREWIRMHDKKPGEGEFLLHLPGAPGVKQLSYLLGFVESLTPAVVLTGALGMYLLWQQRDRQLALLLVCLSVFPLAFLVVLSLRTPVSTFYLVPVVPAVYIGAGVFLDQAAGVNWGLRPRWLVPATLAVIIIAAGAPTLLSQYRDGRRYDFRGAAGWLDTQLAPEDIVFSDQAKVMAYYLPSREVERLRADPLPLVQSVFGLRQSGARGVLWIVAPAPSHAFRTSPALERLKAWIYGNCQLRKTIGKGRMDFRQYYLQLYRCPASGNPTPPITSE